MSTKLPKKDYRRRLNPTWRNFGAKIVCKKLAEKLGRKNKKIKSKHFAYFIDFFIFFSRQDVGNLVDVW